MLIELKRCNSIGNINGMIFLVAMLKEKCRISMKEILNRCALESSVVINSKGAVAFLAYLDYLEIVDDEVIIFDKFQKVAILSSDLIIDTLIKQCFKKLVNSGVFDSDGFVFDEVKGKLKIKASLFPFTYAAIRNFLITAGALDIAEDGQVFIVESYDLDFSTEIFNRRRKLSLTELMKKQEEQSKRGLEAEEFVLEFERKRLQKNSSKIKRISDFDVSAGYDIVSFIDDDSIVYDRLIEVKSYIGKIHFYWSENEADVAKFKGNKYVLCLVDYERINEFGYVPIFIIDPYDKIFTDNTWIVNTASFKITKI